jgi:hypothetical protein
VGGGSEGTVTTMYDKITAEQLEELEYAESFDKDEFHKLLEEYTGITGHAYRIFAYYDSVGNYLGNSTHCDVRDLLENAYIKVVKDGDNE